MIEIWLPVKGFEFTHHVSNFGRVKSLPRETIGVTPTGIKCKFKHFGKILCNSFNGSGYKTTAISINGAVKTKTTHRLVACAFIPNPNGLPQVNHMDGDKLNNYAFNLEWCSASQNQLHAIEHGLINHPRGTNRAFAKLTDDDIRKIRIQISTGITQRLIAREFDVSPSQITSIKQGKTWAHVI
jgi:hypothetical protein